MWFNNAQGKGLEWHQLKPVGTSTLQKTPKKAEEGGELPLH
jgi:hypothetical protein